MIKTYDFILAAKHDKDFMKHLKKALSSNEDSEIHTDIYRLIFDVKSQMVSVVPKSNTGICNKIVPKKIKYLALMKMLNGEWDNIEPGDITEI